MTVEEAIKALQENGEHFSYDVPHKIFEQSVEDTASALMCSRGEEDYQRRTNEEWSELIREENDPLEAAKSLLEWIDDRAQAITEFDGAMPPVPSSAAIFEALDSESLPELRALLNSPEAFEQLVRDKYLPRPEGESSFGLDTQEAMEAAIVDEKRLEDAARTWTRLSEQERQIVQEVTDRICGDGQGEELGYDLDIHMQPYEESDEEKSMSEAESTIKVKLARKSMLERARESLNNLKPGEWLKHCRKSDEEEDRAIGRCPPKDD